MASFAIGRTEWNYPLIAVVAGFVLLVGARLRTRARARAERVRQMTLVHLPTKDGQPHEVPPAPRAGGAPRGRVPGN